MGVASAITVKADAECASLLSLAYEGHQIVRGLTLPHPRDALYQHARSVRRPQEIVQVCEVHSETESS